MKWLNVFAGFALTTSLVVPAYGEVLPIGTNPQGSLFYSMGSALASVMVEKTENQYRVSPYAGSSTFLPMVNAGRLAFGFANGAEAAFAYKGIENFDGRANGNLRLVGVAFATQTSFAVPTDSSVKSIEDLRGKRLPSGYNSGRTFHYYSRAALASGDLTISDAKKVPTPNFVKAIKAMAEDRADAALVPMNTGQGKEAMATMNNGWRYISLNDSPEARSAVNESLPSARIVSMEPAEHLTGVVADPTNMIEIDFYIVTGAHVSDDVVYELVMTMAKNKDDLASAFGAFNRFDPEKMVQKSEVPYHPGAIKAYKELGILSEGKMK